MFCAATVRRWGGTSRASPGRPTGCSSRSNPARIHDRPTEKAREAVGATYEEYLNIVEVGTPEQLVERLQPVVDAGVNYLIAYIPDVAYDHDRLRLYAEEIIPHIR